MKTPHKHAELIKAWADGAEIEVTDGIEPWVTTIEPFWRTDCEYRIKPEPKPDVVRYVYAQPSWFTYSHNQHQDHNLKLTFDGKTNKLIKAEVI